LAIANPPGVIANDVLIAAIYWQNSRTPTVTPPVGWVLIRQDGNMIDQEVALYYHVVTPSEPTTYTWFISSGTRFAGIIAAYSGVSITNPIDVAAGQTGSAADAVTPAVTTSTPNALLVIVWSAWNRNVVFSPTSDLTVRRQYTVNDPIMLADVTLSATGLTGTRTATGSPNPGFWTSQVIALRPAP
jgi:hypothetical protein